MWKPDLDDSEIDKYFASDFHPLPQVIAPRGCTRVEVEVPTTRVRHITLVGIVNAAAHTAHQVMVFANNVPNQQVQRCAPGWRMLATPTGWQNADTYRACLEFLYEQTGHHPFVAVVDAYSAHFDVDALEWAREHGIAIVCLPAHSTRFLQPLDKCVFSPFTQAYRVGLHDQPAADDGSESARALRQRVAAVHKAWTNIITPSLCAAAFAKTGHTDLAKRQRILERTVAANPGAAPPALSTRAHVPLVASGFLHYRREDDPRASAASLDTADPTVPAAFRAALSAPPVPTASTAPATCHTWRKYAGRLLTSDEVYNVLAGKEPASSQPPTPPSHNRTGGAAPDAQATGRARTLGPAGRAHGRSPADGSASEEPARKRARR